MLFDLISESGIQRLTNSFKMKKRSLIPPLPEPFVLTEGLEIKLRKWIDYFKNMSDRVVIKSVFDPDFLEKMEEYKTAFKLGLEVSNNSQQIEIKDWDDHRKIAFIVCFDSSRPGEKKMTLVKDGFVFCYGDFAFDLHDLEQTDETGRGPVYFVYQITDWPNEEVLTWRNKAECFKDRLIQMQKLVPKIKT